jgi:hypothetical protein
MEELVKMVEADLREVVEAEVLKFRDRYRECQKVDSIYINEDFAVGVYDVLIHGLVCNHYLNIFVTSGVVYEFPEFRCSVVFEDKEMDFRRELAHILLIYTVASRCYIKTEIYYYDIREVAEHLIRVATLEAEQG